MAQIKKKVLIITYYWPPSGGAGVQRWLKLSYYLAEIGFDVYVITVDEKFATYPVTDSTFTKEIHPSIKIFKTKSFEFLKIYQKFSPKKQVPYAGFSNENKSGWIQKITKFLRGNLLIPDARIGWNKYAYAKAEKLITDLKIDTLITTSPPHSTQLIGLALKNKFKLNWIADLRDPWTDIYYYHQFNHTSFAKNKDKKLEKEVLINADKIVVVSNEIKKLFELKTSKNLNISIIPNGFDEKDFEINNQEHYNSEFKICYTGTIASNYPIHSFCKVLQSVINKIKNVKITFHFFGNISIEQRNQLEKINGLECRFTGHVSHKQAIEEIKSADLLLLIIPDTEKNKGILTGKLFEYLASLNPILAFGPVIGNAAEIITKCNSGKTFDYDDFDGAEKFLFSLIESKQNRSNLLNPNTEEVNKYSRRNQAEQFAALIG